MEEVNVAVFGLLVDEVDPWTKVRTLFARVFSAIPTPIAPPLLTETEMPMISEFRLEFLVALPTDNIAERYGVILTVTVVEKL